MLRGIPPQLQGDSNTQVHHLLLFVNVEMKMFSTKPYMYHRAVHLLKQLSVDPFSKNFYEEVIKMVLVSFINTKMYLFASIDYGNHAMTINSKIMTKLLAFIDYGIISVKYNIKLNNYLILLDSREICRKME